MYQLAPIRISLQWFPGRNCVQVPYNRFTVNLNNVPQLSGVYILYYRDLADGYYYPFYVGQSNDLHRRLLVDHLANSEPNQGIYQAVRKYQCGFKYALIRHSDQTMRKAAEAAIYHKYHDWFLYNDPSRLQYNTNYSFDLGF